MNYKYKIGNHCVQIKDELGLLDLDFDFFEPADSVNRGDVICHTDYALYLWRIGHG